MSAKKMEVYDVSKKMREIIEWKHARRLALREKYLRESLHPAKQELIIDEAFQRINILRYMQEYYAKVTTKTQLVVALCGIAATTTWILCIANDKESYEDKLRSGKIKYADRQFKFQ